ncbi:MAG: nitroreductase family protein [Eubacteriales bacterium]|nr:nitroreductase family protein [Eubacteriales bacterium]
MSLLEIMKNRRSVRKYTGEAIPEEKMNQILQAALLAPSSRGRRPWEFVLVKDKELLEKLSSCREMGSAFLKDADQAVVVLGDTSLTDVWVEDCSIAMTMMYLMADSLGVGCCWIQGRNRFAKEGVTTESYVKELLEIPEQYALQAIMAFGIPENHPEGYDLEDLCYGKIHRDYF